MQIASSEPLGRRGKKNNKIAAPRRATDRAAPCVGDMQQTTLVVRKYHEPRVPIEAAAAAAIRIISRPPAEPETGSKKRKGSRDPELGLTGSEHAGSHRGWHRPPCGGSFN